MDDPHAISRDLLPSELEEPERRESIVTEDPVHVRGGHVPWLACVDDDHPSAGPTEGESGAEARRPAADDHDIGPFLSMLMFHVGAGPKR